jgi:hypothetical protein
MIKIKKDEVKIKVPKDEEYEEAYLLAELAKGIIKTAKYLDKDIFDVLSSITAGIIMTKDNIDLSIIVKMGDNDG